MCDKAVWKVVTWNMHEATGALEPNGVDGYA